MKFISFIIKFVLVIYLSIQTGLMTSTAIQAAIDGNLGLLLNQGLIAFFLFLVNLYIIFKLSLE